MLSPSFPFTHCVILGKLRVGGQIKLDGLVKFEFQINNKNFFSISMSHAIFPVLSFVKSDNPTEGTSLSLNIHIWGL